MWKSRITIVLHQSETESSKQDVYLWNMNMNMKMSKLFSLKTQHLFLSSFKDLFADALTRASGDRDSYTNNTEEGNACRSTHINTHSSTVTVRDKQLKGFCMNIDQTSPKYTMTPHQFLYDTQTAQLQAAVFLLQQLLFSLFEPSPLRQRHNWAWRPTRGHSLILRAQS